MLVEVEELIKGADRTNGIDIFGPYLRFNSLKMDSPVQVEF